jgi:hypothetical protein
MHVKVDDRSGHKGRSNTENDAGAHQQARAERLVAEYLRYWGLRDPSTIAVQCRDWVRQATEILEHHRTASDGRNEDLCRVAISVAIREIDRWLDHLARQTSADATSAPWRRGLLAMRLQNLLEQYPQAWLQYEQLPDALFEKLRSAARPVVPAPQPVPMNDQPLGELPSPLQPAWWRNAFARTLDVLSGAGRILGRNSR